MTYIVSTSGRASGKGILVTDDWAEAVRDIRAKIESGCTVTVRLMSDDEKTFVG